MQRTLGMILIALTSMGTYGQAEPTNCSETFNYAYTLDELLDQFRDDDIRYNLAKASEVFWSHPDLTAEYVYKALNHEDWQVRQIMCREIWYRVDSDLPGFSITPKLIAVSIEGLRHDTTPFDWSRRRGLVYFNAQFGVSKLIPIAHDWANELEEAMESDDHQQRLLAAYILGRGGVAQSAERASQILLPHLRDNDLSEDAKFCVYGLGGFGPELLPHLNDAMPAADAQQRDLMALLITNLIDPVFTDAERAQRQHFNSITTIVHDPASQRSSDMWSWMSSLESVSNAATEAP